MPFQWWPKRFRRRVLLSTSLHGLHEVLKVVKEASDICPPLKTAVAGLLACVDACQRTASNREEMERILKSIDALASLVARRLKRMSTTSVSYQRMEQLASDLENIVKNIQKLQARRLFRRLAENSVDSGNLIDTYKQVKEILDVFQLEVGLEIERNVQDILKEVVIRALPRSHQASFCAPIKTDTLLRGPCTIGTRVDILDKIMSWAQADDCSPPVFWLTGLAGTGKTTIAYTICERMEREKKPLASFFCSRRLDSKDSDLIVPTISRYLAEISRSYATKLVAVLQGASVHDEARIRQQIDKLLVKPWSDSLPERKGLPVPVVVIDALDESDNGVEFLKNLFDVVADGGLTEIKFLVTSRVEPEIVKLFDSKQLPADMIRLHEVPLDDVQGDIAKFLEDQLPEVDTNERNRLTERAGGLFIYAATAVRFISPPGYQRSSDEKREKFRELLEHGAPSGLDDLYKQVLSVAFREEDAKFRQRRLDILHAVVCAQELISITVVAQLLSLDEGTTKACINSLHSVLYVSPRDHLVSFHHVSFPEFILDAQRSRLPASLSSTAENTSELEVFCDGPIFNAHLVRRCFEVMESQLGFSIYHITSSSKLDCEVDNFHNLIWTRTRMSPVLRYVICHWGEHLLFASGAEVVPATVFHAPGYTNVIISDTAVRNVAASSEIFSNAAKTTSGYYTSRDTQTYLNISTASLHGLQKALKIVKEVSDGFVSRKSVFPPRKSVIGGLLASIDAYQRTADNYEEMKKVIKSIDGPLATLVAKRLEWSNSSTNFEARMVKLERDLNQIIENIQSSQSRGLLARLANRNADAGELVSACQKIEEILRAFQLEISLDNERNVQDILKEIVIRDLPRSRDASFRAAINLKTDNLLRGPCTSGTRVEILDKIMSWARVNDANSPPVFWLTGLAGTGKTTIAYTICEHMWAENRLLVSFFCSRRLDSKDSRLIVPTICRNLAELFRSYAIELVSVLQSDSVEARIREQIDKLLVAPWSASLSRRDASLPAPVVVIDALDESDNGVEFLKSLLRVVGDKRLTGIKFLVTSRAQPEIVELFHSFQLPANMICRLHEVPVLDVQGDIAKFLTEKLPMLRHTEKFQQLSVRAGGLFILAAIAVRYISPPDNPVSQDEQRVKLQQLLEPGGLDELYRQVLTETFNEEDNPVSQDDQPAPGGHVLLDELYKQVLSEAFDQEDQDSLRRRVDILHAVVCAQERISVPVIAQLLDLDEDTTKTCINSLHYVLYVSPLDNLVSCYYASFPEFILDAQRSRFSAPLTSTKEQSRELNVFCDKPVFNAHLARCCFRIMRSQLHFNRCNLSSSSKLDREVDYRRHFDQRDISPVLRYAVRHWGEHVLSAGSGNSS